MTFTYREIITKNGVHSSHFEIFDEFESGFSRKKCKVKIATAYYKHNAKRIVNALNQRGIKN